MLDHQAYRANQELHSPLSCDDWANFNCPTVVAVPITPNNELVMVQPSRAKPNGWIFPQGAIRQRNETLFQVAARVLAAELGYPSDLFASRAARLLGKAAVSYDRGKQYYIVALPMLKWCVPNLSEDNNKYCVVGGPGELRPKIGECSKPKQELIQRLLLTAIEQELLYRHRWHASHAEYVIRSI